jgi:alcohol dehydrogenase class IV
LRLREMVLAGELPAGARIAELSIRKERRLDRMADAMGLKSGDDIPEAIRDMNARLGLPTGLAAMGVQREQFAQIIKGAMADHCHNTNPRIATAQHYEEMLAASL